MTTTDAYDMVINVLVGILPNAGEAGLRGAMWDAILTWPDVDWREVIARLRAHGDADKIAAWLEDELIREEQRQKLLRGEG